MKTKATMKQPVFVAAGFIALDMVLGVKRNEPRFYAGGTTGNLLATTAYLGWHSVALGRLNRDNAGIFVDQDLSTFGVDTTFLHSEPTCATPIVVQKIFKGRDGKPKHTFAWTCPDCGAYLPGFRALVSETADRLAAEVGDAAVFFTDRVSRSAITLAKHLKRNGAVIFFEPSTLGDPSQFVEMLKIADVLKYSDQRAKSFSDFLSEHRATLEIQTLGEEGLRFRVASKTGPGRWSALPAFLAEVVDTAGAGDWTSAGLITELFKNGRESLKKLTKARVQAALEFGQAVAALNCNFEGARGLMYSLSVEAAKDRIKDLRSANIAEHLVTNYDSSASEPSYSSVCPACSEPSKSQPNGEQVKLDARRSKRALV